jgi:hypothetical protein
MAMQSALVKSVNLYGIPVFTSSNADTGAGNSATDRICLMGHKDSMVLVEQIGIRSQTQYKQDYLGYFVYI